MTLSNILLLMMTTILVENYVFSQFLGICPFLGVSGKRESAVGMGFAVIFVMTLSGAAEGMKFYLMPSFSSFRFRVFKNDCFCICHRSSCADYRNVFAQIYAVDV